MREQVEYFRDYLGNVTGAIVNVDDFRVHENHDGTVDKTKTDLYLHLVDRKDNSVLEVQQVLAMIDENVEYLDNLFKVSLICFYWFSFYFHEIVQKLKVDGIRICFKNWLQLCFFIFK